MLWKQKKKVHNVSSLKCDFNKNIKSITFLPVNLMNTEVTNFNVQIQCCIIGLNYVNMVRCKIPR